jgi:hypothetical protein
MSYYVRVGRRGHLIRAGTFLLAVMGSLCYWWGSRRRPASPLTWTFPEGHPRDAFSSLRDHPDEIAAKAGSKDANHAV